MGTLSLDPNKITLKEFKRKKQLLANQPVVKLETWNQAKLIEAHIRERMKKEQGK